MYDAAEVRPGNQIRRTLQLLHKEMEVLSHWESGTFLPYETIVRADQRRAGSRGRGFTHTASESESPHFENGHIDRDTETV